MGLQGLYLYKFNPNPSIRYALSLYATILNDRVNADNS